MLHTILIVDDEELLRKSFIDAFTKKGYNVLAAEDGVEALEIVKKNFIDLAIADVNMPKMDGIALLRELKSNYPDIPVIIMTGCGSENTAVKALSFGASNYLKKPFKLQNITDTVEKVLFYKVAKDRLQKKEFLIKKTLQNLKLFELEFPIDIEAIEGGLIFISEYLFNGSPFKMNVEIGLHEALLNAYYHGSLKVLDYANPGERTSFYSIADKCLQNESVKNKKIILKVSSDDDKYSFRIIDDGGGFDWKQISESIEQDLEKKVYGRGITLLKAFFDEVSWNKKGNEITMILKKDHGKK